MCDILLDTDNITEIAYEILLWEVALLLGTTFPTKPLLIYLEEGLVSPYYLLQMIVCELYLYTVSDKVGKLA